MLGKKRENDFKETNNIEEEKEIIERELTEDEIKEIYNNADKSENPELVYELIIKYQKITELKSEFFIQSAIKLCDIYFNKNKYCQFKYILLLSLKLLCNGVNFKKETFKGLIKNYIELSLITYYNRDYIEYVQNYFKKIKQDEISSFIEDCLKKFPINNFDIVEFTKEKINIKNEIKIENKIDNNNQELFLEINENISQNLNKLNVYSLFLISDNCLGSIASIYVNHSFQYYFVVFNLNLNIISSFKSENDQKFSQIFQYLPNKFILTLDNKILFISLTENQCKYRFISDKNFSYDNIEKCINIEKINSEKIALCYSNNKVLIFSGICYNNITLKITLTKINILNCFRVHFSIFALFSSEDKKLKIELFDQYKYEEKSHFIFNKITKFNNLIVKKINKNCISIFYDNNKMILFNIITNDISQILDFNYKIKKITYNFEIQKFIFKTDSYIFIVNFNENPISFEIMIQINIDNSFNDDFIILNQSCYFIKNNKIEKGKLKNK